MNQASSVLKTSKFKPLKTYIMATEFNLELPDSCPFSVRRVNESIIVFREHDAYGQYPNIYTKICSAPQDSIKYAVQFNYPIPSL